MEGLQCGGIVRTNRADRHPRPVRQHHCIRENVVVVTRSFRPLSCHRHVTSPVAAPSGAGRMPGPTVQHFRRITNVVSPAGLRRR